MQGKVNYNGAAVNQGNLSATIYSASSGGTLLYSDTFLYAINNSFFDVMLGAALPLNLSYGENYWLDLSVNGQDITWGANSRLKFYSSVGNATAAAAAAAATPRRCQPGWIEVPGSNNTGFCVMKYEAKNLDGVVQSVAAGTPYVSITQTAAITACSNIGARLCTTQQALTISRDIESVASNWQNNAVGSGCLYGGHMNNNPAAALAANESDNYPYTGTGCSATDTFTCPFTTSSAAGNCKEQRRTFALSNGDVIWDWSGNVWEWLVNTCTQGTGTGNWQTTGWLGWDDANLQDYERPTIGPSNSSYTSAYGAGRYYGCSVGGNAFIRGGSWGDGANAGSFALYLSLAPSYSGTSIGFRCCSSL